MDKKNYNVYLLIDPRNNLPFYVGKGKGKRYNQHQKEYEKRIKNLSRSYEYPILQLSLKHLILHELSQLDLKFKVDVVDNLTQREAFILEQAYIAWFGRKVCGNGILTNLLSGGKEGNFYFNEQALIELYRNSTLRSSVLKYDKTSKNWIANELYFLDDFHMNYCQFKKLTIDWLYSYHQCNQQFALKVIELLKSYDAVITPYYWVRKVTEKSYEFDNLYIMDESFNFILEKSHIERRKKEFNKYIEMLNDKKNATSSNDFYFSNDL